ncbi:Uncharacterised protein [Burkholderia pseudomallei]|nr:transcriptional regulator, Cro/CI family [Burkholderia pseudomallei MSHR4303]KKB70332.1 transcriptional regulator, Cro/CI family [Burkholderia pseudomallei MSHR1079]CAK0005630.1 Uncharacterised protein [Burkholderia pseudomallei]
MGNLWHKSGVACETSACESVSVRMSLRPSAEFLGDRNRRTRQTSGRRTRTICSRFVSSVSTSSMCSRGSGSDLRNRRHRMSAVVSLAMSRSCSTYIGFSTTLAKRRFMLSWRTAWIQAPWPPLRVLVGLSACQRTAVLLSINALRKTSIVRWLSSSDCALSGRRNPQRNSDAREAVHRPIVVVARADEHDRVLFFRLFRLTIELKYRDEGPSRSRNPRGSAKLGRVLFRGDIIAPGRAVW